MLLSDYDSLTSFLCGLFIGGALALVVLRVWKASLAIIGALAGLVSGIMLASFMGPSAFLSDAGRGIFLGLCSFIGGALAVRGEKKALLLCTPLLGSFLVLQGFDHFLPGMHMSAWDLLSERGQAQCSTSAGAARCVGIYFAVAAMTVAGVFVQWRWTAGLSVKPAAASSAAAIKAVPEMIVLASPNSDKKKSCGSSSGNPFASPVSRGPRAASPTETGNPFSTQRRSAYGYHTPKTPEFFEG